jgi:hypothetical protein
MPLFTLFAIILFNVLSILKTSCQEYVIILIISVLLQCTTMIINYIYKKKITWILNVSDEKQPRYNTVKVKVKVKVKNVLWCIQKISFRKQVHPLHDR